MSGVAVQVSADTGQTNKKLEEIRSSLGGLEKSAAGVTSAFSTALHSIGALLGGLAIGQFLSQTNKEMLELNNKIKQITDSSVQYYQIQKDIRDAAFNTRSTVGETATLYNKFAISLKNANASSQQLASVTQLTAQAVKLSGANAETAAASIMQLGQGLGSGTLRGEELNSVLEGTPRLARAIADGMGTSIAGMRSLAAEGGLTTQVVFESLLSQSGKLETEYAGMTKTFSSGLANVSMAMREYLMGIKDGLNTSDPGKVTFLDRMTKEIRNQATTVTADTAVFMSTVRNVVSDITELGKSVWGVFKSIGSTIKDALPSFYIARTLIEDITSVFSSIGTGLDDAFGGVFTRIGDRLTEILISFKTFGGALDTEIEAALREVFKSRSILEFIKAFDNLKVAIDNNSTFILSQLMTFARGVGRVLHDVDAYFGLVSKFSFQNGNIESLYFTVTELWRGLTSSHQGLNQLATDLYATAKAIDIFHSDFVQATLSIGKKAVNTLSNALFGEDFKVVLADTMKDLRSFWNYFTTSLNDALKSANEFARELIDVSEINRTLQRALVAVRQFIDYLFVTLSGRSASSFLDTLFDVDSIASTLSSALDKIKDFANRVIQYFFEIWDAVIGHSWWTDTIDTVIDTSNTLWDKVRGGLTKFRVNVENTFKSVFSSLSVGDISFKFDIDTESLKDTGRRLLKSASDGLAYIKNEYPDAFRKAMVGGVGLMFVRLFPESEIAKFLTLKLATTILLAVVLASDMLLEKLTGSSPLTEIFKSIGMVLGDYIKTMFVMSPDIISAAIGGITGLVTGILTQISYIGPALKKLFDFPVLGDIAGLIFTYLFGKGIFGILNALGMISKETKAFLAGVSRLYSTSTDRNGLIHKALFGQSELAIMGMLMLITGGFHSLLGDSLVANIIAAGGLATLIVNGFSKGPGGASKFGTILDGIIAAYTKFAKKMANLHAGVMSGLAPMGAQASPLQGLLATMFKAFDAIILAARLFWAQLTFLLSGTSPFMAIQAGLASLKASFAAFAASNPAVGVIPKVLFGKYTIAAIVAIIAMLSMSSARAAQDVDLVANAADAAIDRVSSSASQSAAQSMTLWGSIKETVSDVMTSIKDNFVVILMGLFFAISEFGATIGAWITGIASGITLAGAAIAGAVAAAFTVVGALSIYFFGEGDTFFDKLDDAYFKLKKLLNLIPKNKNDALLAADSKISTKASTFATTAASPITAQFDYSNVDLGAVVPKQYDKLMDLLDKLNKTLEKAADQVESTGSVAPGVNSDLIELQKQTQKQIDKLGAYTDTTLLGQLSRIQDSATMEATTIWAKDVAEIRALPAYFAKEALGIIAEIGKALTGDVKPNTKDAAILNELEELRLTFERVWKDRYLLKVDFDYEKIATRFAYHAEAGRPQTEKQLANINRASKNLIMAQNDATQANTPMFGSFGPATEGNDALRKQIDDKLLMYKEGLLDAFDAAYAEQNDIMQMDAFQRVINRLKDTAKEAGLVLSKETAFGGTPQQKAALLEISRNMKMFEERLKKAKSEAEALLLLRDLINEGARGKLVDDSTKSFVEGGKAAEVAQRATEVGIPSEMLKGVQKIPEDTLSNLNSMLSVMQDIKLDITKAAQEGKGNLVKSLENDFAAMSTGIQLALLKGLSPTDALKQRAAFAGLTINEHLVAQMDKPRVAKMVTSNLDKAEAAQVKIKDLGPDASPAQVAPYLREIERLNKAMEYTAPRVYNISAALSDMANIGFSIKFSDIFSLPPALIEGVRKAGLEVYKIQQRLDKMLLRGDSKSAISAKMRELSEAVAEAQGVGREASMQLPKSFDTIFQSLSVFGVSSLQEFFLLPDDVIRSYRDLIDLMKQQDAVLADSGASHADRLKAIAIKRKGEMDIKKDQGPISYGKQFDYVKSAFADMKITQGDWEELTVSSRTAIEKLAKDALDAKEGLNGLGKSAGNVPKVFQEALDKAREAAKLAMADDKLPQQRKDDLLLGSVSAQIERSAFDMLDGTTKTIVRGFVRELSEAEADLPTLVGDDLRKATQLVIQGLKDKIAQALSESAKFAEMKRAGEDFSNSITTAFSGGLKDVLKGKTDLVSMAKMLVVTFTDQVIDTFINGMMTSIAGKGGVIDEFLKGMGASLFATGADSDEMIKMAAADFNTATVNFSAAVDRLTGKTTDLSTPADTEPTDVKEITSATDNGTKATQTGFKGTIKALRDIDGNFMIGLQGLGKIVLAGMGGGGGDRDIFVKLLQMGVQAMAAFSGTPASASSLAGGGTEMLTNPGDLSALGSSAPSFGAGGLDLEKILGYKFDVGGVIPGNFGAPLPIIAHGGEVILNARQQRSLLDGTAGGGTGGQVFNINITGDVSRQTRAEIQSMIPQIASGVNMHNYEQNRKYT